MTDALSPAQFGFVHYDIDHPEYNEISSAIHDLHREGPGTPGRLNLNEELHSNQSSMYRDQVDFYKKNPQERAVTSRLATPVEVYNIGGRKFVGEGHHRIAAGRESGQRAARAVFYGGSSDG